jgi:hypothetical protein
MRGGVHVTIVFGPDADAWLTAESFPQRAAPGTLISVISAIRNTTKSIYYRLFVVAGEASA